MKKLEGKTVFITGGLSGIGKACAVVAAHEGANVAIVDIKSINYDSASAQRRKSLAHFSFWPHRIPHSLPEQPWRSMVGI